MTNNSIRIDNKTSKIFIITEAVTSVISSGNASAMKVLLNNGIGNRNDFIHTQPLYNAIASQNSEMVDTLLTN